MTANAITFSQIPNTPFEGISGSTGSDVMGPITLDNLADLPTMPVAAKKDYYGKRFALAGGKLDDSEDDVDESDGDDAGDHPIDAPPTDPPISHHVLPNKLPMALVKGYRVKHVVDLTPGPLNLGYDVIKSGGSYVAVCATAAQLTYLKDALYKKLMDGVVDPNERLLYDARFSKDDAGHPPHPDFNNLRSLWIGSLQNTFNLRSHPSNFEILDFGILTF